jgi:hypothetical protein
MSNLINEGNLNLALQALQKDPKLSLPRTAQIYNISRPTLHRRQQGNNPDAKL